MCRSNPPTSRYSLAIDLTNADIYYEFSKFSPNTKVHLKRDNHTGISLDTKQKVAIKGVIIIFKHFQATKHWLKLFKATRI